MHGWDSSVHSSGRSLQPPLRSALMGRIQHDLRGVPSPLTDMLVLLMVQDRDTGLDGALH